MVLENVRRNKKQVEDAGESANHYGIYTQSVVEPSPPRYQEQTCSNHFVTIFRDGWLIGNDLFAIFRDGWLIDKHFAAIFRDGWLASIFVGWLIIHHQPAVHRTRDKASTGAVHSVAVITWWCCYFNP